MNAKRKINPQNKAPHCTWPVVITVTRQYTCMGKEGKMLNLVFLRLAHKLQTILNRFYITKICIFPELVDLIFISAMNYMYIDDHYFNAKTGKLKQ